MKAGRLFTHRLVMTPVASYIGYVALGSAGWALITAQVSMWNLVPLMIGTFALLMGVTVGMHRLFCHSAFKTAPFWHAVLAYLGTLAVYGSTVQWSAMHMSHHRYSDTDKDPHYTGWRYLFWKKNNVTEFNQRTLRRLYRQPIHRFFYKWYSLVIGATVLGLFLIDPWLLVFLYLAPLGWLHFVGSIHQVFAHDRSGPRDQGALELVLFTGGEWLHGHHHENPKDARFGKLDAGYRVINFIKE